MIVDRWMDTWMDRYMLSTVAGFRLLQLQTDAARPVARASCEGHSTGY